MSFQTFGGEKRLADLVRHVYGDLDKDDRERARAALLRANPQLTAIKDLAPGSLIVVPEVPRIPRPDDGDAAAPSADAVREIAADFAAYLRRLDESVQRERDELAELDKLLKSRSLQGKLRQAPGGADYVQRVRAAAKDRAAEHERRRELVKELAGARDELAELVDRLR